MADNDRFVISLVTKPKECAGCEYDWETCEITCPHNTDKGKTREEWEEIVTKNIYDFTVKKYSSSLSPLNPDECEKAEQESEELAKSVVEELFK